jgi:hypothetical protein
VLKKAGLEGRDTVFLFSDTQIVQEGFLEDLNNILNAGEMCCAGGLTLLLLIMRPAAAASQTAKHHAASPSA